MLLVLLGAPRIGSLGKLQVWAPRVGSNGRLKWLAPRKALKVGPRGDSEGRIQGKVQQRLQE
jgi:hypothetical protein